MKAVGYIRVSTDEQAKEGYSLAAQEKAIAAYCAAQGWDLVHIYNDAGRSGKSTRGREDLARLLEDAQAGTFERVVFWRLDRLARNLRDLLAVCDTLESRGMGLVSIQEAIDTGSASGRMVRSVLGALAEFEREVIAERIRSGLAEKARQGQHVGRVPYGMKLSGDLVLVPDPDTAPTVRELFALYATGRYSLRDLTARLGFHESTKVAYILHNRAYVPLVVGEDLFDGVQEQFARRRNPNPRQPYGREPYPLTGVAHCGYCDARLVGASSHVRYMRCYTTWRRGRGACPQPMVKAEVLEAQVADYVRRLRLTDADERLVMEELERRRVSRQQRQQAGRLRRELDRWHRLFVLGEIDESTLRGQTKTLRGQLVTLEGPEDLVDVREALAYLRDLGQLWQVSPPVLQREFIQRVFARIAVRGQHVDSLEPRPLYAALFTAVEVVS